MSDRKKIWDVPTALVGLAGDVMPQIERMTAYLVDKSRNEHITIQELFDRMSEDGQVPMFNNNPLNSLKIKPTGKHYLPAKEMLESVFRLYEAPKVKNFIEDVARCMCRARTCSTTDEGCDLGKPIRDAMQILAQLFPMLRDQGEVAIMEPEEFLSKFIAAFFIFGFKSPFSLGNECTHFCESACTQVNLKERGVKEHVEISFMERTMEFFGSLIGKTPENPFGLYKYLFLPPEPDIVKQNGHIKVKVIGMGPASMQYALRMRREGYDVEMIEKECHMRNGELVPNFGGTWFNGVPYNKRNKEDLMRYYYLMKEMDIKMTIAEVGKTPGYTIEELEAEADVIFNGAGLVGQPMDLELEGEKDENGKDKPGIVHAMSFLQPNNAAVVNDVVDGKVDPKLLLELALPYEGKTVVVTGAGYTEKDCTEWFSKFNHALKAAGKKPVNVIVLERQEKDIEGIRGIHDKGWPHAPATLETKLAAMIQGKVAGVDRQSAVVIKEIKHLENGRMELTLDVRKLEKKSDILKDKRSRKYVHDKFVTVECDMLVKALGFKNTLNNPSRLDRALGAVELVESKRPAQKPVVRVLPDAVIFPALPGEAPKEEVVQITANRAKKCGVYYGGDNNLPDKGRASANATLVAAMADGERAAEASIYDIQYGLNKDQKAWDDFRTDLKKADIGSWLRQQQTEHRAAAEVGA